MMSSNPFATLDPLAFLCLLDGLKKKKERIAFICDGQEHYFSSPPQQQGKKITFCLKKPQLWLSDFHGPCGSCLSQPCPQAWLCGPPCCIALLFIPGWLLEGCCSLLEGLVEGFAEGLVGGLAVLGPLRRAKYCDCHCIGPPFKCHAISPPTQPRTTWPVQWQHGAPMSTLTLA